MMSQASAATAVTMVSACGREHRRGGKNLDVGVRWIVQDLNFGSVR